MKFLRFVGKDNVERYGWLHDDCVGLVEGNLFGEYRRLEASFKLSEVKILAPVIPEKIICLGRNFVEHAKEQGVEVPESPLIFLKPPAL